MKKPDPKVILKELLKEDEGLAEPVERLPTGSLSLDLATGGGWPRGRLIEIFGNESTGKSMIAYTSIGLFQKLTGGVGMLLDIEGTADEERLVLLGVDKSLLIYKSPESLEEAYNIYLSTIKGLREKAKEKNMEMPPMLVVLDSIGGGTSEAEFEEDNIGSSENALRARINNAAVRKILALSKRLDVTHIWLNQIRSKIRSFGFGEQYMVPGGSQIGFHASLRVKLKYTGMLKKGDNVIGATSKAKIVKNKVSKPFCEADMGWYFDSGLIREHGIIDMLTSDKKLTRASGEGARALYKANGFEVTFNEKTILHELEKNKDISKFLVGDIMEKYK